MTATEGSKARTTDAESEHEREQKHLAEMYRLGAACYGDRPDSGWGPTLVMIAFCCFPFIVGAIALIVRR